MFSLLVVDYLIRIEYSNEGRHSLVYNMEFSMTVMCLNSTADTCIYCISIMEFHII